MTPGGLGAALAGTAVMTVMAGMTASLPQALEEYLALRRSLGYGSDPF